MFNHVGLPLIYKDLLAEMVDGERLYTTPAGDRYPSITTILSMLSKDAIDQWKKNVGQDEADRTSRHAATRGTALHQIAEDYLANKEHYSAGYMPIVTSLFSSLKPVLDLAVGDIYAQEVALYSDKLQIAGRVDCIANWNGKLSIIDFKTSAKPKKIEWIESYFMQCAFYGAALYEQTGLVPEQSVIAIGVDYQKPQIFIEPIYKWIPKLIKVRNEYKRFNRN